MLLTWLLNSPVRVQKCVAIALLISGFVVLFVLAVSTFEFVADRHAALVDLREKSGRLNQILALKDSLTPAADNSEAAGQSLFLEAESVTIGRANLQSRIDAIAQTNGLLLSSAGGLPDLNENGLMLVGLSVDMSGGYEGVNKAIVDLETSKPPLLIRELAVRLISGEGGDMPLELSVQIKIFGAFRLAGTAGKTPESAATQ